MVLIAVIAGHTLLELDVGEVSDQLSENGSAGIHPSLFRRCGAEAIPGRRRPFSVQIVFEPNAHYAIESNGLPGFRKVLYRTLVTTPKERVDQPRRQLKERKRK